MQESAWGSLDACRHGRFGGKQFNRQNLLWYRQLVAAGARICGKGNIPWRATHREVAPVAGNGGMGCCEWGEKGALGAEMAQPCLPPFPRPPPPRALRQQELLFHFLQLVSGVEHYQQKFRSQAAVIDEIVDTAFEVNQAGPGRSQMEGEGTGRPGLRGFAWKPP